MSETDFNIEIRDGEAYASVHCTGKFDEKRFGVMVDRMAAHRASAGPKIKYLVDLRGTDYHIDGFARYRIAEGAAVKLLGLRVSVLGNAGVVEKISEHTAYNRGMLVLVTDDEATALRWLEK
jgi:hypothetical protein